MRLIAEVVIVMVINGLSTVIIKVFRFLFAVKCFNFSLLILFLLLLLFDAQNVGNGVFWLATVVHDLCS